MLMVREFSGSSQMVFSARNLLSKNFFPGRLAASFLEAGRSCFLHNGAEAIGFSFRGVN